MSRRLINLQYELGLLDCTEEKAVQELIYQNANRFWALSRAQAEIGSVLQDVQSQKLSEFERRNIWKNINHATVQLDRKPTETTQPKPKPKPSDKGPFWGFAFGSLAASLVVSVLYFTSIQSNLTSKVGPTNSVTYNQAETNEEVSSESSFALLKSQNNQPAWYAHLNRGKVAIVSVEHYVKKLESDLELWAITKDKKVISLGVVPENDAYTLDLIDFLKIKQDDIVTLAISREAKGGSESGQPEGEVLYSSPVKTIKSL